MKIAVLFGGASNEHQISVISGTSIIANLDKAKYTIYPIYIDENNEFYEYTKNIHDIKILNLDSKITELKKIDNIIEYLQKVDVVFPVLHGKFGEDGTIQGMLDLIHKKYVGCHPLSSSICMDKEYTKAILKKANIKVTPGVVLRKYHDKYILINDNFERETLNKEELIFKITNDFTWPIYLKAANSGSSVGVNKVHNIEEFFPFLEDSFKYDDKVLIEKGIKGREVECAILGNEELIASTLGEVLTNDNFYSFSSKYQNSQINTVIPAKIDESIIKKVQEIAKKAYHACNCEGLSRVDFFIEEGTNEIILNEINTLPGFTEISMYPKLMEYSGISYSELLDRLINLAK